MIQTGDKTFETRTLRFEDIKARRQKTPPDTYKKIAADYGVSKQAIYAALAKGEVRPSGRPRSNGATRRKLETRLGQWLERRRVAVNKDSALDRIDARLVAIRKQLADL